MVRFNVFCTTEFGQNLFLKIGNNVYPMTYERDFNWVCDCELSGNKVTEYEYYIINPDGAQILDSPKQRYLPKSEGFFTVNDTFGFKSVRSVFETKAFADCIMKQPEEKPLPKLKDSEILYMLNAPTVGPSQGVVLTGNHKMLGNWNPNAGIKMKPFRKGWWWVVLPSDCYLTHAEHKFVVYDKTTDAVIKWESGENRRFSLMFGNQMFSSSLNVDVNWHGSGVAIPVFSLRSESDWGVGEFKDLKLLVNWVKARNQQLIQILPINDTTSTHTDLDSYPYRANSVYALHPMYLNMEKIGVLNDKDKMSSYRAKGKELNLLPKIDYSAVNTLKNSYIKDIFEQEYDSLSKDKDFKRFVKENDSWLKPYAAFCCLRDEFGTDHFNDWEVYSVFEKHKIDKYIKQHQKQADLCYFVQYHLDRQLHDAIEFAHSNGVVIKGDLPIGISATSVDAWVNPRLFNLDKRAGAPPDDFSYKGQNWGFPTYNWREMEKDRFKWWKSRFANMGKYFDAFRIDHILGFFRIWEIPNDAVWGLLGYFSPAMPLSIQDIENYGIKFDYDRFVRPYITQQILDSYFGNQAEHIAAMYMNQIAFDRFEFRQEFDAQKKLEESFEKNNLLPDNRMLLDKLLSLFCEVIFIADPNDSELYHPRIEVSKSYTFSQLNDHEKWCLQRLHDEFFYHRHTNQWYGEAMRKLPALLNETDMLVCGEDLGMVPACVPEVMKRLQILSLEVQRMPKNPATRFVDPNSVPYLSVSCTGTHDTSTLRMWWKENRENTQWYYNNMLGKEGVAPDELTPLLAKEIVDRHLNGNSLWTILPWQDYLACDGNLRLQNADAERINCPDDPKHIWCWRMHLNLK